MFIILVISKFSPQPISLFYKNETTAKIAHNNIHEFQCEKVNSPVLTAIDDFGHVLTIKNENLSHVVFVDCAKAAPLAPPEQKQQSAVTMNRRPAPFIPPVDATAQGA